MGGFWASNSSSFPFPSPAPPGHWEFGLVSGAGPVENAPLPAGPRRQVQGSTSSVQRISVVMEAQARQQKAASLGTKKKPLSLWSRTPPP